MDGSGPEDRGDAACWLDQVCDACGGLRDGPPAAVCERCGPPVLPPEAYSSADAPVPGDGHLA